MNSELEKIIEKTHSLYFKYGIKSVSMDDVARELAMSKKTLYLHVKDKRDLVEKVLEYENQHRTKDFTSEFMKGENAIDQLIQVNTFVKKMITEKNLSFEFDLDKYYPDLFEKITEYKRKFMFERMLQNMKRGKEEGIYREDLNSEIIAGLYITRFSSSHFFKFFFENSEDHSQIHREIIIYHIRGIANAKGIEILESKIKNNEI